MAALKKTFSHNAGFSGKCRFDLMLAKNDQTTDLQSDEIWSNCAKVDCAFLVGSQIMTVRDNCLKIKEFVRESKVVLYALRNEDEALDKSYPLHADNDKFVEEPELDKYVEEVIRAFMKEIWKKALAQ